MSTPRTGLPWLDEPRQRGAVVALAHRGGPCDPEAAGPENTLAAFQGAVTLGYRYLETDVQVTSDGHLLAFHDEALDRVTDRVGRVRDHRYAEVEAMLVGGREPIPRLADLVEILPAARWNVDLKVPEAVDPVVELITRRRLHDRFCVGSFDERVLRRFRRRMAAAGGPRLATTCGVMTAAVMTVPAAGRQLQRLLRDSGAVLQVPVQHRGVPVVTRRFVDRAHASGRHVHVWTVNERAEMEHLLDLGVDGLITDRTDVLKDVLVGRGLWEAP